jgi:isoleucyl-tRNA synthetase
MVDYREEVRIGPEILARVIEAYRKLRNTARILVGNLYDFDPARDSLAFDALEPVDRFVLGRYADMALRVLRAYEEFEFHVIFHALNAFATVDLSAFYVDVSKDRLYTLGARSKSRRAAQTAVYVIADGLTRLMAPVLPITSEQLWKVLPGGRPESVHLSDFPRETELTRLIVASLMADWQRLLALRDSVNAEIERQRKDKRIGNSLGARITIRAGADDYAILDRYRSDLPMLFIVSEVTVERVDADEVKVTAGAATGMKCSRCWRFVSRISTESGHEGLCDRCIEAMAEPVRL